MRREDVYHVQLDQSQARNLTEVPAFAIESLVPADVYFVTSDFPARTEYLYVQLAITKPSLFVPVPRNYAIKVTVTEVELRQEICQTTVTSSLKFICRAEVGKHYKITLSASPSARVSSLGKLYWTPKIKLFVGPQKSSREFDVRLPL